MAKNQNDEEVLDDTMTDEVVEVEDTEEESETETTDVETESEEEADTEEPEEESETESDEDEDDDTEEVKEPEKPNKKTSPSKKKTVKKKQEDDTDAELDAFFEKLRKNKEKQIQKQKKEGTSEKMFTQTEFEKALKSALAKRLPSKEEREQFEHWKESQQTLEEKMSVLMTKNSKLTEEIETQKQDYLAEIEKLKHENTIIKAGVEKDAVEFVQYKVEKMDGDFDDNLQMFLKENKRYVTPKTTIVEAAEHKPKVKVGITKKDLDKMGYVERAQYREEHPEEYAKAMGR